MPATSGSNIQTFSSIDKTNLNKEIEKETRNSMGCGRNQPLFPANQRFTCLAAQRTTSETNIQVVRHNTIWLWSVFCSIVLEIFW